ncbi:MAG: hypothetical protein R3C49_13645 [Planctomycetaceae bacterium]
MGFDELMAELHQFTRTSHPMIENPYRVYGVKMINMLNKLPVSEIHPRIQQHAKTLAKSIRDPQKQASFPEPFVVNAYTAWKDKKIAKARKLVLEQFSHVGTFFAGAWTALELAVQLEIESPDLKFQEAFIKYLQTEPFKHNDVLLTELALSLIRADRLELAKVILNAGGKDGNAFEINSAQIEYREGTLTSERRTSLRRIAKDGPVVHRFCAFVLLGQPKTAVDLVEKNSSKGYLHDDGTSIRTMLEWPICDLIVGATHKKRLHQLC